MSLFNMNLRNNKQDKESQMSKFKAVKNSYKAIDKKSINGKGLKSNGTVGRNN